ncbi:hypothetical protein DFH07DRAFT_258910 [Mycena maculata]|uniref:Proteophosphoglycan ppg4 n=1 Tax=Mycena maculata TaxID=230809 RepID=A0AAD7JUM7_9AGAR|nr:hypothetical protein DFH07DRAFT_258910 [Mycena maculata]
MSAPSLVGGTALRAYDLPAGIVFAAVYGLLLPAFIYRMVDRSSRTFILIQIIFFAAERVVVFSLRAAETTHSNIETLGLNEYQQATFALGFLNLTHVVAKLARTVLVNTTKGPESSTETSEPALVTSSSFGLWRPTTKPASPPAVDDPRSRYWFRRWSECMGVLYLAAMVTAIVATANIYAANDVVPNRRDQALRYSSAAIGLVLVLALSGILLWAQRYVPRVDQRAVRFLLAATTLLTIPPIYRLVVMRSTTPNIADADHQPLNTLSDKAAFYVLHVLPEWTVVAMLCMFNVRDICHTGLKGDEGWRDESPKERAKREKKDQERAMKKAAKDKNAAFEMKSTSNATDSISSLA